VDYYKVSEGKCELCKGGGRSAGGDAACTCSTASTGYNTTIAYNSTSGCTCTAAYAKDANGLCTRELACTALRPCRPGQRWQCLERWVKQPRSALAAVCAAGYIRDAAGTCSQCKNGASNTATSDTGAQCSCSGLGPAYDKLATYDQLTGCACATGYAKDAKQDCTREWLPGSTVCYGRRWTGCARCWCWCWCLTPRLTPPPAVCAADYYRAADGTCKPCLGGGSTAASNNDTTCGCSLSGEGYNKQSSYSSTEGCTCAAGYVKDTQTKLCNSCDAGFYKATNGSCVGCIGGGTSARGNKLATCTCPNTNQGVKSPGYNTDP
jgi:hypothetical protein